MFSPSDGTKQESVFLNDPIKMEPFSISSQQQPSLDHCDLAPQEPTQLITPTDLHHISLLSLQLYPSNQHFIPPTETMRICSWYRSTSNITLNNKLCR
eukprot:sb/3478954/